MYIVKIKNDAVKTEIHGITEKLKSGQVVKGINAIDSFSFSILPSNVGFKKLFDLQTLLTVYNTNKNRYEFYGRVLYSSSSMESSGLLSKEVTCESYMGFFCDSMQEYVAEKNWTVDGLLSHIVNTHNSQVEPYKRFTIGEVDVEDPNDNLFVGIQRENSWQTLQSKLVEKLGGELRFRVEGDVIYLDYLKKIGNTLSTEIKVSKNMQSVTKECDPSSYITRLIPLGAKLTDAEGNETEERLDIASVNDGKNYIEDTQALSTYGIRYAYVKFDDVTTASNLLRIGQKYLAENNKVQIKYTATALDLSLLGLDINDFDVHNYYPIKNHLLGIEDTARVIKKTIDVCNTHSSTIDLGENFKTLSDLELEREASIKDAAVKIEKVTNQLKEQVASTEEKLTQKIEGIDGIFFYIKYSQYADGHVMTDAPDENTQYMGTCSAKLKQDVAPLDYREYTWVKIRGNDGEDGIAGESQYFHIKYSDDGKTFTENNGETLGNWMGTCVNKTKDDPTNFSSYTWRKIVGEDGKSGIDGADGKDGESYYFYVKFSKNSNGNPMTETPTDDTKYMGVCSTKEATAPADYTAYKWTQCRGNDGEKGEPGPVGSDGRTQYLHVKYSDDGKTFTENNGETLGAWIGTLVDFNEADSIVFNDYTWKKFTEDVDEDLGEIRQTILEQRTELINTCDSILMEALKSYTETSSFEEYKEQIASQFKMLADNLTLTFTEEITKTNGAVTELQKINSTYFTFDIDGMTIGKANNPNKVVISNDIISIQVNGVMVQSFDANGRSIIPELKITKSINEFGFITEQDSTGNVNCRYAGN